MRSSMRFKTATNPRYSSVSACARIRWPSAPASMRVACSVISYTGRTAEPASHHAPTKVAPVPTSTTPPAPATARGACRRRGRAPRRTPPLPPPPGPRPWWPRTGRRACVAATGSLLFPIRGLEPEPNAPHSVEQLKLRGLLELAPQIAHMDVDDVALGVEVEIPHLLEQLGAPDHLLRPEEVIRRTELLEKVWDLHFDPESNVVDVHVGNLRRKLQESAELELLHTVRGVGFRLQSPDREEE